MLTGTTRASKRRVPAIRAALPRGLRRRAAFGLGVATGWLVLACGARTGLDSDQDFYSPDAEARRHQQSELADAAAAGEGGVCGAKVARENDEALEAGTGCSVGPALFECNVASTGTHGFQNYCLTNDPTCSVASDPTCTAQCNAGEYGILCSQFSMPGFAGCRVVYPASAPGPEGFAFCCSC